MPRRSRTFMPNTRLTTSNSLHDPTSGEIRTQLLIRDRKLVLFELFCVIGEIPGRQFVLTVLLGGKGADLFELRLALGQGLGSQVGEELHHLPGLSAILVARESSA